MLLRSMGLKLPVECVELAQAVPMWTPVCLFTQTWLYETRPGLRTTWAVSRVRTVH